MHYNYQDLGYGILLKNPEEDRNVLLQGDDAENFRCGNWGFKRGLGQW